MKRDTAAERRNNLIYQRARGRAITRLIRAHQDEYDTLFAAEKAHAEAEADALDLTAKTSKHGDEPARLKSGRKARARHFTRREAAVVIDAGQLVAAGLTPTAALRLARAVRGDGQARLGPYEVHAMPP